MSNDTFHAIKKLLQPSLYKRVPIPEKNDLLSFFAMSIFTVLLIFPAIVHAADIYWTGGAVDPYWYYGMNWTGHVAPVDGDAAYLTGAGSDTALVTLNNAACSTLQIGDGTSGSSWKVDVRNARTLQVGDTLTCGGNGTALVWSGAVIRVQNTTTCTAGGTMQIGSAGTLDTGTMMINGGTLNLDGGTLTCTNLTKTSGILDCSGGGSMYVHDGLFDIGQDQPLSTESNLECTLNNVTYVGSTLRVAQQFFGHGNPQNHVTVILTNGTWFSGSLYAGMMSNAEARVVMTGPGTGMDGGEQYVGCYYATGEWDILNGATATCSFVDIGGKLQNDTGLGILSVSGSGTVLTVSDKLDVGGYYGIPQGHGEMTISDGAHVIVSNQLSVWDGDSLTMNNGSLIVPNKMVVDPDGSFSGWESDLVIGDFTGNLTNTSYCSLSPGGRNQPGTMNVSGDYSLDLSDTMYVDIGGTNMGSQYDHLSVGGTAVLSGTLDVSLCNDYIPDVGATYDLFDWHDKSYHPFNHVYLPALPPGRAWDTSQLEVDGTLSITGTGVTVEMTVLGGTGNTVIASGDMTPNENDGTDFGNMWMPGPITNTFKIRNEGDTNVTIYSVSLTGNDTTNFTVDGLTFPISLNAGSVTNFAISFHPPASGISTATVSIVNDGIGQNPYTFAIRARGISAPVIETIPLTNTAPEYAECGGIISDSGDSPVTIRGCCWSTNANPTLADAHTENGTGIGSFTSKLTNLTGGKIYYVRAYATNAFGIAYGSELSFRARMHAAGNAMHFDGNEHFINVPNESSFDFTTGMTVEAWFKVDSFNTAWQAFITKGDSAWRLHRYMGSDQISFGTQVAGGWDDLTSTQSVNDGHWHHVAAVQNGTNKYLYLDGVLENSSSPGVIEQNDYPVLIGENAEQTNRCFDGSMDEIRIWNRARTIDEIRDDMHHNLGGSHDGLELYYDFDQLSGTNVDDHSGNGNTGTGINWSGWTNSPVPLADEIFNDSNLRAVWAAKTDSLESDRLSISNANIAGLNFAVFGHNNATDGEKNIQDVPSDAGWRLERVWHLEQSGSVTGTVAIDTTGISDIGDGSILRLLVSSTNSFTNATTYTGSFNSPFFIVPGQTLKDGASYTLGGCGAPGVTTLPVTDIVTNHAQCGGNITRNGGSAVTSRGCCWSTKENPTIADAHTSDGAGTGAFNSALTNLNEGQSYFVRAYAGNEFGIGYGEQIQFVTQMAPPGNALDFSGAGDYVNCGSGLIITGALPRTIEAWAYTRSFNDAGIFDAGMIGSDRADFSLRTRTLTDKWRLQFWGTDFDLTLYGSQNHWHHYALVYDGTQVTLYYDGTVALQSAIDLNTGTNDFRIGYWNGNTFDGQIDELRVWNIARTQQQIRADMRTILNGNEPGLVAYYKFDCQSGTNLFDTGSSGYDGILTNDPTWIASTVPWFTLTATSGAHGTIAPSGEVYVARGADTNFVITPNEYWHVDDVKANGTSVGAVDTFTWSNVTDNGTIDAAFTADLAAHGTPHWWLAGYGLTNSGQSFNEAEMFDFDSDTVDASDEWIADTDPTDSNDYFHITRIVHTNSMAVVFGSSTGRVYSLKNCEKLEDGNWMPVNGQTNVPGDIRGTTTLTDTNNAAIKGFYRVGVSLP